MATPAPPTYLEAISELRKQLGPEPSTEVLLDALAKLPDHKLNIITTNPAVLDQYSDIDLRIVSASKALITQQILKDVNSDKEKQLVEANAWYSEISRQVLDIDKATTSLPEEGPFAPRLQTIYDRLQQLVHTCAEQAAAISTYATSCDEALLATLSEHPVFQEKTKSKYNKFTKDAQQLMETTNTIDDSLLIFQIELNAFLESIKSWLRSVK